MGFSLFEERRLVNNSYYADSTSGTAFQPVNGGGPDVVRVDALILTSNSIADQTVEIAISVGPADYPLGQVVVPALAGTPLVPAVDAVALLAPAALGAFLIEPLRYLKLRQIVALTGSDVILGVTMEGTF